jgi:hypothetical protein
MLFSTYLEICAQRSPSSERRTADQWGRTNIQSAFLACRWRHSSSTWITSSKLSPPQGLSEMGGDGSPQIEPSAFLQLDEDPVEAGGMAIEPTGVLQPLHGQVDRDRAAPERIGRHRQERRDLVGEGRDGTTRVPGSDRRGNAMLTSSPTIAPTTVSDHTRTAKASRLAIGERRIFHPTTSVPYQHTERQSNAMKHVSAAHSAAIRRT